MDYLQRIEAYQRQQAQINRAEFWAEHDAGIDRVNNKILAAELVELYERDPVAYQQRIQLELGALQAGNEAYQREMNDLTPVDDSPSIFGGISGYISKTINVKHTQF